MEDSPSFSLGLTQLDTNPVVEFVPGVFDYEEPNFVENRSKFRNDPNKMKDIRKAATEKSKKEGEKSSRLSKKDDSGRPRLPKVVEIKVKYEKFMVGLDRVHAKKTTPSSSLKSVCQDNFDEKWDDIKLFLQSYDVKGCSEDNATASLDAFVEFVVNQNSNNTNVGTSTAVHVHNDHMDVEGVSANIGPATLECLVAVVENQKLENDNVGTSNMQLPLEFPDVVVAAHQAAKTPAKVTKRIRTRSKVFKSPYTTEYASSSKAIEDQIEEQKQQFAFDGFLISDTMPSSVIEEFKQWVEEGLLKFHVKKKYDDDHYKVKSSLLGFHEIDFVVSHAWIKNWFYLMSQKNTCSNDEHIDVIFYHLRKKSKLKSDQDYRFTITNYFFKNYIDKAYSRCYEDDTDTVLTTQQDYVESARVALIEEAITYIIKGYCMSSSLPWHQVDKVYVPINCNRNFHWVLAVIALKDRHIHWPNLETYRDKITQTTQILNEHLFDVEYVQHSMQQECDSVGCGVFVAGYAEYLSEEINVPSDDFEAEYHRMCYATLLQKYGIQKAKKGYVSENDDPPRPKSRIIQIPDDNAIVCIE
ncbi:hypothetical protein FXO38_23464 [Capsicum annuum]|nr:hypothetical protein FXO38_23464 [Capsicum annuum]